LPACILILKLGHADWFGTQLIRGYNRAGLKKKQGKKKPGMTRQYLIKNPVATR
jgi:hypothetical protein